MFREGCLQLAGLCCSTLSSLEDVCVCVCVGLILNDDIVRDM